MSALTNHTIDAAYCNGYGRFGSVPVWISAVHEGQRVVPYPTLVMENEKPSRRFRVIGEHVTLVILDVEANDPEQAVDIGYDRTFDFESYPEDFVRIINVLEHQDDTWKPTGWKE